MCVFWRNRKGYKELRQNLPIVNFKPIDCEDLPIILQVGDLSSDQSYLYEICQAVQKGNYSNIIIIGSTNDLKASFTF